MAAFTFDVACIGNAIVDVLTHADDATIDRLKLNRGVMTLIDEKRAEEIYSQMGPGVEVSGGSAGNTSAGVAALGGKAAFIGKVHDDQLGAVFRHDLRAQGVTFDTPPLAKGKGPATARCMIFVTPDAHRTMNTYLGACVELGPEDIDEAVVGRSQVVYFEGYLWDPPRAKEAMRKAAKIVHANGGRMAITLSDPFCVGRYRDEFLAMLGKEVDIVFANEEEITALYQCDFESAVKRVAKDVQIAALTRSQHGSVAVAGDQVVRVPAEPIAKLVDTTGAGDLYASGFLYGLTHGHDLALCARLGSIAAAEIISHIGARPEADLAALAAPVLKAKAAKG
jgi:sugar/nucleoside kinase (ribokinase family)